MPTFDVIQKSTGQHVYRYDADAPIEWSGMPFSEFDHVQIDVVIDIHPINPARWKIWVGALFDRFGQAKIAILADPDPLVQAFIKDCSVRHYIDLIDRRPELLMGIGLLGSKGHDVDAVAVLDVEPRDDEVWHE